jgi:hypothetical protein
LAASSRPPDLTPLLSEGDTTGWSILFAEPTVWLGAVGAEILAILAGTVIAQRMLKDSFPGAFGLVKALVATFLAVVASLGSLAMLIETRHGSNELHDSANTLLVAGLLIALYAALGAPIGALAIRMVSSGAAREDRPSFWRAFFAAFLGLAAYGVVVAVWEVWSPALGPLLNMLVDAYKAARGVPPPINSPLVAPSVTAFIAQQVVAFAVFVAVVSAHRGGSTKGFGRWVDKAETSRCFASSCVA